MLVLDSSSKRKTVNEEHTRRRHTRKFFSGLSQEISGLKMFLERPQHFVSLVNLRKSTAAVITTTAHVRVPSGTRERTPRGSFRGRRSQGLRLHAHDAARRLLPLSVEISLLLPIYHPRLALSRQSPDRPPPDLYRGRCCSSPSLSPCLN